MLRIACEDFLRDWSTRRWDESGGDSIGLSHRFPHPRQVSFLRRFPYWYIAFGFSLKKYRISYGGASMTNPLKRTYRLNAQKVAELIQNKNMTQERRAAIAGISTVTLSQKMNGEPAYMSTIGKIAKALGEEDIQSLIALETSSHAEMSISVIDDASSLASYMNNSNHAKAMLETIWKAMKDQRPVIIVIAPSVLALLCCLVGLAPMDARPFFIAGLVLSTIGIALAYSRKWLLALPLAMLLINLIALIVWPTAIGFFPTKTGYRFGVGERPIRGHSTKSKLYSFTLNCKPFPRLNDLLEIVSDTGDVQPFVNVGRLETISVDLEPGTHEVTLRMSGQTKSVTVTVEPIGKLSNDLVFDFVPDPNKRDDTTYGEIWFVTQNETLRSDNVVMMLDGKVIELMSPTSTFGGPCFFQTTVGWHNASLRVSGKEVATKRFYANPRIEYRKDDITKFGEHNHANIVNIDW